MDGKRLILSTKNLCGLLEGKGVLVVVVVALEVVDLSGVLQEGHQKMFGVKTSTLHSRHSLRGVGEEGDTFNLNNIGIFLIDIPLPFLLSLPFSPFFV